MPRRPRVFVDGGVYHVYNRVASGEHVFGDPEEGIAFIDLLRGIKRRDGWTILGWCVMSNHYHLALRTSEVPLWRGMQHLQCYYSKGFNRRFGRTGSLWQSRYQARMVDEARYLAQLVLYVHLNPIRAGAVAKLEEHAMCGHREIVKRTSAPLIDVDDTLLAFGSTARSARRDYMHGIKIGCEEAGKEPAGAESGLFTGEDRELEPKKGQVFIDAVGRSTGLERPILTATTYLEEACRIVGISLDRISSRVRDSDTAFARRLLVTLAVERWRIPGRALAEVMGKSPQVVSNWVSEGVRKRLGSSEFAAEIDELDQQLVQNLNNDGPDGETEGETS